MIDISLIIAILGGCLATATFFIGRQTASRGEGERMGSLSTDLKYIKESVERIEERINDDVKRLEGRIDEISNQVAAVGSDAARAYESAKSAHKRQDEHLEREHGINVRGHQV